jgi:hypothetical protein
MPYTLPSLVCSFPSLRFCLAPPPSASVSARCYLRCRCCFSPTRRGTGSSDIHIPSIGSMPCGSTTFGPTRQPPNGRGWTTEDLVRLPRPPHPSTQHLQPSLYPILSLISVILGNPMTSLVASFLRPLPYTGTRAAFVPSGADTRRSRSCWYAATKFLFRQSIHMMQEKSFALLIHGFVMSIPRS